MTESEQFIALKAILKHKIFQVLDKFNIKCESEAFKEFEALIDKINFTIEKGG